MVFNDAGGETITEIEVRDDRRAKALGGVVLQAIHSLKQLLVWSV
jgi:hypothetical protein